MCAEEIRVKFYFYDYCKDPTGNCKLENPTQCSEVMLMFGHLKLKHKVVLPMNETLGHFNHILRLERIRKIKRL